MVWQRTDGDNIRFGRMPRVTAKHPCPICRRPDWCLAWPDDSAAICQRVSDGAVTKCGEAGWLHVLDESRRSASSPRRQSRSIPLTPQGQGATNWSRLALQYLNAVEPARLVAVSQGLGVSEDSLRRLGIGWSQQHRAWSFPMSDSRGNVRGIRLRCLDGRKPAVRGGHDGLFRPSQLTGSPLLITEGPTDCSALLDMGFAAIGRPSCRGAVQFTAEFVRSFDAAEVVIIADRDDAGRSGADSLASTLIAYARRLRIIEPPPGIKDAREWKAAGASHTDVLSVMQAAVVRSLSINTGGTDGPR